MAELGYLMIVLAFGATIYAAIGSVLGARRGLPEMVASGRRAMLAAAALTIGATLLLLVLFLLGDFTVLAVWKNSSRTTPLLYVLTGLWGSQEGSLLFWSALVAGYSAVALAGRWRSDPALLPYVTATCAVVTGFFLLLVAFVANPFERLAVVPGDGSGLNPLLQHPGMAFHPPTLYLGLTGMTIPFAYAMAALASGRLGAGWIGASRRALLVAWAFLSIGLALGGRWAYDVLGWGGYWGWDPVENAALMPWLAATAFLHSVMVQERRGIFRVWNMALIILSFTLVLIGTFLTRAGVVSSVHAFAQSDIGPYFLAFIILVLVASLTLLWRRLPALRSGGRIESVASREAAFLGNNLLFMGALFAVFWGTLFPLFSEIVIDQRVSVKAPYFNIVVMPIFGMLVLLMGIGPLVGWRRSSPKALLSAIARPAAISAVALLVLVLLGVRLPVALAGFGVAIFALLASLSEIVRGVGARMRRGQGFAGALVELLRRQRRRYGGYLVHVGVALLAIGVTGNLYQAEAEAALDVGQSMTVGDYKVTFGGLEGLEEPDRRSVFARLSVERDGRQVAELRPQRALYRGREEQPVSIPGVQSGVLEDVYALLGTYSADEGAAGVTSQRATVKVYVNPLVAWVWLGMIVLVAGTVVAAWPDTAEARRIEVELRRLQLGEGDLAGAAGAPSS